MRQDREISPELERSFTIIAHRARSSPDFSLDDLCGSAGRWDGLVRCINCALLVSHGIRRNVSIHIYLLGDPDPGKVITLEGVRIRSLNPDERSTAALMKKALGAPLSCTLRNKLVVGSGMTVTRTTISGHLDDLEGPIFLLDEAGEDMFSREVLELFGKGAPPVNFILSDDRNLTPEERKKIEAATVCSLSVGPVSIQAHQAIAVVNNYLDRLSVK